MHFGSEVTVMHFGSNQRIDTCFEEAQYFGTCKSYFCHTAEHGAQETQYKRSFFHVLPKAFLFFEKQNADVHDHNTYTLTATQGRIY